MHPARRAWKHFTPLVTSTTGGMVRESRKFYARISEMISKKKKKNYAFIASWIRRKISFALANSFCVCLCGSRSFYYTSNKNSENSLSSFAKVSEVTSNVGATLLSFWVSYIKQTAYYHCIECIIVMRKYDKTELQI